MSKKVEKLYIYCRVSSNEQKEKGVSLVTQERTGRRVAKDLNMVAEVRNEQSASSATSRIADRYQLNKLMNEVKSGKVKNIWVSNIDRMSRNTDTWYGILKDLINYKINVYVGNGTKYSLNSSLDKLVVGILSQIAVYDNESRTVRFAENKVRKFLDGYYVHGTQLFGYQKISDGKGKILAEHETNSRHLKQMFKIYAKTGLVSDVSKYLMREGVRSIRNNKLKWSDATIRKILENETYAGVVYFDDKFSGQRYKRKCKALISRDLWNEVQDKMVNNKRRTSQVNRQNYDYLLTGMLYCGVCGYLCRGLKYEKNYKNLYYCGSKGEKFRNEKYDICDKRKSKSVNIDLLDNIVWNTFCDTIKNSHVLREMEKNSIISDKGSKQKLLIDKQVKEKRAERRDYSKQIAELQKKKLNVTKLYAEDVIKEKDLKELLSQINLTETEMNYNIEQVDIFLNEIKNTKKYIDWYKIYMTQVDKYYKMKSIKQKRKVLQQYIERIYVSYDFEDALHKVDINLKLALFDDVYNVTKRVGRKREYEIHEGSNSKSFYMESAKLGRKKKVNK